MTLYDNAEINSGRDVLLMLFRDAEGSQVNTGTAEQAADEIIDTLKHYGFLIVSNTPNLFPQRERDQ